MPRPKIQVDWTKVDQLLEAGCDGTEVAAYFGMHEDTFYERVLEQHKVGFTAYKAQKRARGNSLLLGKQFQVAMSGDKTMLVWLGKQRLKQTDKAEVDHTSKGERMGVIELPSRNVQHNTVPETTGSSKSDSV